MDIGYAICAAAIALAAGIAYIDRASLKAKVENAGKQVEMRMAAYRNSLRAIVKYDIAKAIADDVVLHDGPE